MSCPFCGSTDVADLVDWGRTCLDCENVWLSKSDKRCMGRRRIEAWRKRHTTEKEAAS